MRRIVLLPTLAVLFIVLSAASAMAKAFVETFPVSFTLTSDACSNLPEGTTITGSGTAKSITTIILNSSGVATVLNATHAHGTATDQDGNVYVFDYSNEFRASNTTAEPDVIAGRMTDHFSLSGRGPAKLNNGFVALFTAAADFSSFGFDAVISQHGDPLSFPDGAPHCDPL
jgi:hypothetical protein